LLALGAPEILKAVGRKLGTPDGVLNVLVPEQRPGVLAGVGLRIAATATVGIAKLK